MRAVYLRRGPSSVSCLNVTLEDPGQRGVEATTLANRFTSDYYQSFGWGFFEYFQLSEDIGAEPVPILNVGMACQYNSAELAPLNHAKRENWAIPAKLPSSTA